MAVVVADWPFAAAFGAIGYSLRWHLQPLHHLLPPPSYYSPVAGSCPAVAFVAVVAVVAWSTAPVDPSTPFSVAPRTPSDCSG